MGNFTGGPVVKPLHFCLREHGWEAKIPWATRPKKKKKKNYCGASNQANRTDFLMIS